MPRPPLSASLVLISAACAEASVPAPVVAAPPESIEVRLSDEDKAWLAELIDPGRQPASAERESVPTARSEPRRRRDVGLGGPDDVRDKMRLVTEGPVTSASYNTGSALYEGQQVLVEDEWVREGGWRAWHPDGKPWEEGAYRGGEEEGPWRWWYENGNVQALGTFADGEHVGGWTYYHENGYVLAEGVYEGDRPVGLWRTYHDSGALHSEGSFVAGKREDRWTVYDPQGVLDPEASGLYRAGERVGE
ncbi:MAG TPA: toxin-antitoxin system YwqK family antitoxin [Planctomycetota bacterium]